MLQWTLLGLARRQLLYTKAIASKQASVGWLQRPCSRRYRTPWIGRRPLWLGPAVRALTSSLRRTPDTRWTLQPSEVDLFVKRALVLHQGEAHDAISGEEMAVCSPLPLCSLCQCSWSREEVFFGPIVIRPKRILHYQESPVKNVFAVASARVTPPLSGTFCSGAKFLWAE